VDAQATTTIRELATIRRTAGGPSQRRGYGEAGDAAGAMVGIATAYDGGCSASRFPHLKEGIGRNFLTRGRALVGGGSGSSPVRWIWLDGGQVISNLWHNSGVRAPFFVTIGQRESEGADDTMDRRRTAEGEPHQWRWLVLCSE
jgi:hypothetical protein